MSITKRLSEIVVRDAIMVRKDSMFIYCKHCSKGAMLTESQVFFQPVGKPFPFSWINHNDNCIVLEAQQELK